MTLSFRLCALLLLCALLYLWWHIDHPADADRRGPRWLHRPNWCPSGRPAARSRTNGFIKTETLNKETGSWLGTTSSSIRLNATYRYEIELRSKDWNILIDDGRHVAFVVAPALRPQVPVAVDSATVEEWTESGWGRFDKWEQLQALRREVSPGLEKLAGSAGYIEVARGQARITVEEFVADWLLKSRGWPKDSERFVKVYFADEADIPFPEKKGLKDFLP